jgi:HlyD family secretion protein
MMKKLLITAVVLLVVAGGGYWVWQAQSGSGITFRQEEVTRGRLVATVGSTGTLMPRETVDVGAQVLGQIIYIGQDSNTRSGIVDWGSEVQGPVLDSSGKEVKPGTLLAQIDPRLYAAQRDAAAASVKQAEAALLQAKAQVESARADVQVKTATLFQATRDWGRAEKLLPTGGVAQAEHDQYHAAFDAATANLAVSKANLEAATASVGTAQAQINVTKANLANAQQNLDYCTIRAPTTGLVIDRRVNVGQTVVASLSAPSLFLIAKDLTKMEVWATVNEVDIGRIKAGAKVDFTVDSNPGRVYHGEVVPQGKQSLRFNATMTSNVVTYTVAVSADNSDLSLKPYQTTNLSFIVADKKNALLIPNAALRWQPAKDQLAPDVRAAYYKLKNKKHAATDADAVDHGLVWTLGDDGFVRFIEVHTGLSDSARTEVLPWFKLTDTALTSLGDKKVPEPVLTKLKTLVNKEFDTRDKFLGELAKVLTKDELKQYQDVVVDQAAVGDPNLPEHTRVVTGEEKKGGGAGGGTNPFSIQMFKGNKAKD